MKERMQLEKVEPAAYQAMFELENYVTKSGLDRQLLALIKIRSSQINGCSFCIDMHPKEARKNGETEQRIYALNACVKVHFLLLRNVRF